MAASFQRAVLNQENVTCIVYPAKSWSPHQARPDQNRIRRRKNSDPLRQIGCRFQKLLLFPDKCATVRQLQLAGGGGSRGEKQLDSRVLLALRQFPRLARMGGTPFLAK